MLSSILRKSKTCDRCSNTADTRIIFKEGEQKDLCQKHADREIEERPMDIEIIQEISLLGA